MWSIGKYFIYETLLQVYDGIVGGGMDTLNTPDESLG